LGKDKNDWASKGQVSLKKCQSKRDVERKEGNGTARGGVNTPEAAGRSLVERCLVLKQKEPILKTGHWKDQLS